MGWCRMDNLSLWRPLHDNFSYVKNWGKFTISKTIDWSNLYKNGRKQMWGQDFKRIDKIF